MSKLRRQRSCPVLPAIAVILGETVSQQWLSRPACQPFSRMKLPFGFFSSSADQIVQKHIIQTSISTRHCESKEWKRPTRTGECRGARCGPCPKETQKVQRDLGEWSLISSRISFLMSGTRPSTLMNVIPRTVPIRSPRRSLPTCTIHPGSEVRAHPHLVRRCVEHTPEMSTSQIQWPPS